MHWSFFVCVFSTFMGSKIYFCCIIFIFIFVVSCLNFQKTPSPPYRATPTFPKLHSKDMKLPLYGGCGFTLGVSYRTTMDAFLVFLALLFKSRVGWFGSTFGGNVFLWKRGGEVLVRLGVVGFMNVVLLAGFQFLFHGFKNLFVFFW